MVEDRLHDVVVAEDDYEEWCAVVEEKQAACVSNCLSFSKRFWLIIS